MDQCVQDAEFILDKRNKCPPAPKKLIVYTRPAANRVSTVRRKLTFENLKKDYGDWDKTPTFEDPCELFDIMSNIRITDKKNV